MSTNPQGDAGDQEHIADAGSDTDQYVTGADEPATFTTDEEPRGDTPAHGSGNAGVNALGANRPDVMGEGDPSQ